MSKDQYPEIRYASYVSIVLLIAYSVSYIDRQILSLMVGPIQRDLGINDTQISLLQGLAFAIFYTTVGLFFGKAADHRNRRNLVIMGVVVWSLATAAGGLATSFATGQVIALYLLANNIIGMSLGPTAVAFLTNYYFKDEKKVGTSLGFVCLAASVVGVASLVSAYRTYQDELIKS